MTPVVFDEVGFRDYLIGKKYSRGTVINYVAYARKAFRSGATAPDDAATVFVDRHLTYQSDVRKALRRYAEYQEVAA